MSTSREIRTCKATDPNRARKQLVAIAWRLRAEQPSAAASIEEGLDESLTVKHLKLPSSLERILSSTNAIENLMGSVRDRMKRLKSGRSGNMRPRWVSAALPAA